MNDQRLAAVGRFSGLIGRGVSYLYLVIVAITAYEVIMRYGFDAPTIWVHDLAVALCAAGFVFGGPVALSERGHIAITAVYELASPRTRLRLDVINSTLTLIYLTILSWAAYKLMIPAILSVEMTGTAWNMPIPMLLKITLFLGALLMFVQAVANLMIDIRAARSAAS